MPKGLGFVHHSRSLFCRAVPNPSITIRDFSITVRRRVRRRRMRRLRVGWRERLARGLLRVRPRWVVRMRRWVRMRRVGGVRVRRGTRACAGVVGWEAGLGMSDFAATDFPLPI
jgi:hypothetical protein